MDSVDADQLRSTKHAVILNIKSKPSFTGKTSLSQAVSLALAIFSQADEMSLPGAAVRGGDRWAIHRYKFQKAWMTLV